MLPCPLTRSNQDQPIDLKRMGKFAKLFSESNGLRSIIGWYGHPRKMEDIANAKLPRGNSHGGGIFGKLITKPFQDYKRAKDNDGVLVIHEKYQYHKEAVLMGKSFLSQCNDTTLIENRQHFRSSIAGTRGFK